MSEKNILYLILICVLFSFLSGCCVLKGTSIFFPDSALEVVIRSELGKPFFVVCTGELDSITELNARGMGIKNLQGLEYCTSLVKLDLRDNAITSISPLRELKNLVWLDLGNNKITDITPIAGLVYLEYLDLSGSDNDIRDWSPLLANVDAGGLGPGDTVTLSPEWTVKEDGTYYEDFLPVYQKLINAGVNVIFAEPTK
ncbi:MAG TPA: leucine-rich repeat domain-containing protein [Candidatus Hydrogenedens sp.]|nr:leucine-rich repeat domain-containing protein [Candidatus Hydrogenedens sp.]HOL20362.1 leucine-rich repeat domain-containing protein [Candidatus Hydrogenedens sp.]HPP58833.1 leucine-rich repeat domain-containing protein [Candidatus Hydrogenedens sp.]